MWMRGIASRGCDGRAEQFRRRLSWRLRLPLGRSVEMTGANVHDLTPDTDLLNEDFYPRRSNVFCLKGRGVSLGG